MAIVTIDAGSRQMAGAIAFESYKHGIEVEQLCGNQLELTCSYDEKLERLLGKYPSVKILHTELIKLINE